MSGPVTLCAHLDDAPKAPLDTSTAGVRDRAGTIEAEATGAAVAEAGDATGPLPVLHAAPGCSTDGVTGNRVQLVYAVPAGRPDRYDAIRASLVTFVSRVDDTFQASSALGGGNLAVRWVTAPDCSLSILRVPVSVNAEARFSDLVTELTAVGLNRPDRKYLVLVDTPSRGICGVAQQYLDDSPAPTNYNNGRAVQFARVDTQCWGRPDHSTEAHELVHTLGGVQRTAPHTTQAGHCVDEADAMCYSDGQGVTMQQVCPTAGEAYLDCRSDDYFAIDPPVGSYLSLRWNVARSDFLTAPEAPVLTISAVQEVRGSSFSVTAAPGVRSGQTWALTWSMTAGCTATTPLTGAATTLTATCPATMTAPLTISAALAQSDGQTVTASAAVTTRAGSAAPVTTTRGTTPSPTTSPATPTLTGTTGSRPATTVTVRVPTSRAHTHSRLTVRGRLQNTSNGGPLIGVPAQLQWRSSTTGTWRALTTDRSAADGSLQVTVAVARLGRPGQAVLLRWRTTGGSQGSIGVSSGVRISLLR